MNFAHALRTRRLSLPAIVLIAMVSAALALATAGAHATHAAGDHHHAARATALTARQLAFHDAMRKLWENHVTWTRLAIVSFAAGLPDLQAPKGACSPTRPTSASRQDLLRPRSRQPPDRAAQAHILGAVVLLRAAKAGDNAATARASAAWYANANQVADFLHAANPGNWPRKTMRSTIKTHLDQTLKEAQDRLGGNFAADIGDYEAVHRHILEVADTLSAGIMRQFPRRFR